ncbi:MAG: sodium/proline symporter [Firmicutes bacterium]|nr:sodium/proline symporter [Bacillota bacterium]
MLNMSQTGIVIAIVLYLIGMLIIGYICSKKNNDSGDFYLGGRKLGPLVTAMSAEASDMSSWLLMGLPGVALAGSIAEASWTAIGLAIGTYINWLLVAKRIRQYTQVCGNSVTLPEFFSNRFRDDKNILRGIAAIIIVIFFVPYTASGFNACGKLFASLFNADYFWAMTISAVVIVAYTAMGGFLAASTTDFVQSIIMSFALLVVLGFGVTKAGGMNCVIENAKSLEGYLSLTSLNSWLDGSGIKNYNGITIASTLAWGLGYFGMPHILLRFMAIEDKNKIKLSRRIATIWVVISMFIAIFIGVVGYSLVKNNTVSGMQDPETIIVVISRILSTHGFALALCAGIILAGILASTMSTADSQLLAAASSISEDIAKGVFGVQLSKKKSMLIARITVIAIAAMGVYMARESDSVFRIVSFAWAGFGASFGPVVLFALFWKRTTKWGAFAGMATGCAMVFIWKYLIAPMGGLLAIYELLPAFITACIAIIIVSLCSKAPSKEIIDEFEQISKMH